MESDRKFTVSLRNPEKSTQTDLYDSKDDPKAFQGKRKN